MTAMRVLTDRLRFPEGPIALPGGDVIVVEIRGGALTRVEHSGAVHVLAELEGGPNGAALGPDGWVYICNSGGWIYEQRSDGWWPTGQADRNGWIERVHPETGAHEVLYEACGSTPLRSPNDIVFDAQGNFYFTDLGKRGSRLIDWSSVYYASADGTSIEEVIHPIITPNGIGLSPDGNELYVAETIPGRLWAFDVEQPGVLSPGHGVAPHRGRLVAGLGGYRLLDSLAVHRDGLIFAATLFTGGIAVCSPSAGEVAFAPMPDPYTTNICFDVDDDDRAFVTLSSSGRLVEVQVSGLRAETWSGDR